MKETIFLIIGMIIGGFIGTTVMCCLQINRINELKNERVN